MNERTIRAEALVSGRVQGVGFRYFVRKTAERLGVVGWTSNLPTGEVFVVAEGSEDAVRNLCAALKVGPPAAFVRECTVEYREATGEFIRFGVRL